MRQKQALAVMMAGDNVFLTGAPGAGKTYVLNQFIKRAERAGKKVAVTASTGIAASHLGGTTIHSWSGLGILDSLSNDDLKRLGGSDRLIKRYNATDVLVIDEVSMLHGARLDMINQLAKVLRASEAAFGGLQVILVGDLFQLPPISRGSNNFDFVHLSQAWQELNPQICYITEQHRQQNADGLLELLQAMRSGDFDVMHQELLQARIDSQPAEDEVLTRLFSHNVDVEAINQRYLKALDNKVKTFTMTKKGTAAKIDQLVKGLLAPESLELKIGAEVMFVANNFAEGFVNGSRGRVMSFTGAGLPVVQLLNGRSVTVDEHSWSLTEDGRVRAEVSQLPLRLAWAITIHKSQGMSLDAAEIDLSRAFTPGMGYVALSRVRSLDGLYLKGINQTALAMHQQIYELDRELRQASAALAEITNDVAEEVAKSAAEKAEILEVNQALFDALRQWRLERARASGVAPFIIAHDTALKAIAAKPPTNTQQLLALPGFGPKKVETYGPDILLVISSHQQA